MFATLSERLSDTLSNLRGKGRLSEADIDATAREIRIALLEADVALPVVRGFIARVKERAKGAEVSGALNPAQQVVKIVNEELVAHPRRRDPADPAGQGTAERDHAGRAAGLRQDHPGRQAGALAQGAEPHPAAGGLRPAAPERGHPAADRRRAGRRADFAPDPANGVGDPVDVARRGVAHARDKHYDVVIVDTAGRLGVDRELMQQAADIRDATRPDETLFVIDAMIGQDAVATAEAFRDGVGFTGVVLTKLDGDARGGAALTVREVTGQPILFASNGEKLADFDVVPPGPDGLAHPGHGRPAHPDRAGRAGLRRGADGQGRRQDQHG